MKHIFFLCGLLCIALTNVAATEWPTLRYWPGAFYTDWHQIRMSSDGAYVTFASPSNLMVIDVKSGYCALVLDYEMMDSGAFNVFAPSRLCSVAESGDEFVVVDSARRLSWYHVGDTVPWLEQRLDSGGITSVVMIDDSTVVAENASNEMVCRAGITQPQLLTKAVNGRVWLADSIAVMDVGIDSSRIVNPYTSQTLGVVRGTLMGLGPDRTVVAVDRDSLYSYDRRTWDRTRLIDSAVHDAQLILRQRFLVTSGYILDLRDYTRLPVVEALVDISHDGTRIGFEPSVSAHVVVTPTNGEVDSITVLNGPLFSHAQDPKDSTIYAFTSSQLEFSQGVLGAFVSVTSSEVVIPGPAFSGFATKLRPFRRIRDTSVVHFREASEREGYVSFDDFNVNGPTYHVYMGLDPESDPNKQFYRFSEDGDILKVHNDEMTIGNCTRPITLSSGGSVLQTEFVPGTPYYVVHDTRYDKRECASITQLPFDVVSLSDKEDRVIGKTGTGQLVMSSVADPSKTFASVNVTKVINATWSDQGKSFRFTEDGGAVVSMHSDGRIDRLNLPGIISTDTAATWWWSHEGCVLTVQSNDTIASVDITNGTVLREYTGIPWIPNSGELGTAVVYRVSEIDARITVSLPSGCLALVPGIAREGSTAVDEFFSDNDHYSFGQPLRIQNATVGSTVRLYNLQGIEVRHDIVNADGSVTLDDRGLPHGAYLLVYQTTSGLRVSTTIPAP